MTDTKPNPTEIVRGEIQPWTDYESYRKPAGGPVLRAFLDDLLPESASRTLVAGPHGADVVELVAGRSAHVTVLVRSVSDAATLRERFAGAEVTVLAGALDGLVDHGTEPFDVVLAADGLDRLLGADSPALDWPERAALLRRLATPEALVVVGVENEFGLTGLLDSRPLDERHGDDEWRPLHDDPHRPTSPAQVAEALTGLGLAVHASYASFDPAGLPHTLLRDAAAAGTRPGRPAARLATAGLSAAAAHAPLLTSVADGAAAAARAGQLSAVAPGWLVVCGTGGGTTRTGYAAYGGGVLAADLTDATWQTRFQPADGTTTSGVVFDPALVAAQVPDTESAETLLFRLAAAEDVPGFRRLAARFGAWAEDGRILALDDVQVDGDGFASGFSGWRPADPAGRDELLAAAWHRFRDRLVHAHRRHPWPPWMVDGDDLVSTWLGMSGVEADAAVLKRGREIADALAAAADVAAEQPDVRTLLADAEENRKKVTELAGHIFGLERTLRFRDKSLKTREQQLRAIRDELRKLKYSRSMQLVLAIRKVAGLRKPKRLAKAVKRRIPRRDL
ncbi:hypothetical protein [Jidongwangia harbinensis]|uniref:hypothetical protein n=1 Tax=Jidongwangia harbinensis TaxID=2878561 RepID=UPI001CD91B85|nr:hypothetical protein [Jidongwangia harbinensis]MCA2217353.1 hypothetical protein [Jidongwangia harbinensis]